MLLTTLGEGASALPPFVFGRFMPAPQRPVFLCPQEAGLFLQKGFFMSLKDNNFSALEIVPAAIDAAASLTDTINLGGLLVLLSLL